MPYNHRYGRGRGRGRRRFHMRRRSRFGGRFRGGRSSFRGGRTAHGFPNTTIQSGGNTRRMSTLRLRQPSMVPDQFFCKLKYSTILDEQPGTPIQTLTFLGNGLVDPNESSLGTVNPLGFNEWMAFYGRYKCFASFFNGKLYGALGNNGILWGLYPTFNPPSSAITIENVMVQPFSQFGMVGVEVGQNMAYFTSFMKTQKIRGDILGSAGFSGTATTNPGILWKWVFTVETQNVTTPINLAYSIILEIVYYVKFYDTLVLSQQTSPALRIAAIEKAKDNGILLSAMEMNSIMNPPPVGQRSLPAPVLPPTPPPPELILKKSPKHKSDRPKLGPTGTLIISSDDEDVLMVDLLDAANDKSIPELLL